MTNIIKIRRGLAATWTSTNPVLADGEMGLETDTNKIKMGDGSLAWNSLGYNIKQTDNVLMNGNTISSANTNGNITLSPNGSGSLIITSDAYSNSNKLLATKEYTDAIKQGLDIKDSVRVASTSSITFRSVAFSGGEMPTSLRVSGLQIDGISVALGDRVLIKDAGMVSQTMLGTLSGSLPIGGGSIGGGSGGAQQQTPLNALRFGVYTVTNVGLNFVDIDRSADANTSAKVTPGMFVFVEQGTENADSAWVLTTNGPITLNTTSLAFVQFNGAGQISAGGGMTKSGNTLNIIGTANRISVQDDSVDISGNYVGQNSITTLGTISSGTWQASVVNAQYGGTGISSYTTGDILYGNQSNGLNKLAAGTSKSLLKIETSPEWRTSIDGGTP